MLQAPRKSLNNSVKEPTAAAFFDELGNLRQKLIEFLITLTFINDVEQKYWKQQISGTLVAYADKTIIDLHENFYNRQTLRADKSTFAITAYWLMQLMKESALPNNVEDEVVILYRILHQPGSILNENPKGKINEIVIGNQNVTQLAQTMTRIAMLRYIVENFNAIDSYIQNNPKSVRSKFPGLILLTKQWLKNEVERVKSKVEQPYAYIQPYPEESGLTKNKRVFDEFEQLFSSLNRNVDLTIQKSKSLSTQLAKKQIAKKQTKINSVKHLDKKVVPTIARDKNKVNSTDLSNGPESWKQPWAITLGTMVISFFIFSLPVTIAISIAIPVTFLAFKKLIAHGLTATKQEYDDSKNQLRLTPFLSQPAFLSSKYSHSTKNDTHFKIKNDVKKTNERDTGESPKDVTSVKQIHR